MSEQIHPDEPLSDEFPRVLKALATAPLPTDPVNCVRRLRTQGKRLRAALRLTRALGKRDVVREETFLRRLLASWGKIRDADVVLGWLETDPAPEARRAERKLVGARQRDAGRLDENVRRCRKALLAFARRIERWPWEKLQVKHLRRALLKSHRRFERRADEVERSEAFHDWRKATKIYCYQCELCAGIFPAAEKQARRLRKLGHLLGEEHDAAIIQQALPRSGIAEKARRAQADFRREALKIAPKVLPRSPRKWKTASKSD